MKTETLFFSFGDPGDVLDDAFFDCVSKSSSFRLFDSDFNFNFDLLSLLLLFGGVSFHLCLNF